MTLLKYFLMCIKLNCVLTILPFVLASSSGHQYAVQRPQSGSTSAPGSSGSKVGPLPGVRRRHVGHANPGLLPVRTLVRLYLVQRRQHRDQGRDLVRLALCAI